MTQPSHIVNGRPAITQTALKRKVLVIYTDTGYPRTELMTEKQFAGKSEIHPENVLTHQQRLV